MIKLSVDHEKLHGSPKHIRYHGSIQIIVYRFSSSTRTTMFNFFSYADVASTYT